MLERMRSASLSLLVVLALAAGVVAPRAQSKDESVKEADRIKADKARARLKVQLAQKSGGKGI